MFTVCNASAWTPIRWCRELLEMPEYLHDSGPGREGRRQTLLSGVPVFMSALSILLLVCAVAGCSAPEDRNRLEQPVRIVSLAPSLTKQLYLLGAADRVVGITTYCPVDSATQVVTRVGSVVEPGIETIINLRPHLVITSFLTNRKRVEKLKSLGIAVESFHEARDFVTICSQFGQLGDLVGMKKEAETIVADATARVNTIKARVAEASTCPSVFVQIGARPLFAATRASFLNDLVRLAGGTNVAENAPLPTYGREAVIVANPDYIFVVTMGIAGKDEIAIWRQYESLDAVRNDRILVIDSDEVCSPTPLSFIQGLENMADILHPQKKEAEAPRGAGGP